MDELTYSRSTVAFAELINANGSTEWLFPGGEVECVAIESPMGDSICFRWYDHSGVGGRPLGTDVAMRLEAFDDSWHVLLDHRVFGLLRAVEVRNASDEARKSPTPDELIYLLVLYAIVPSARQLEGEEWLREREVAAS